MQIFKFIVSCLILSFIFVAPNQKVRSQTVDPAAVQYPGITASTIIEDLQALKNRNPEITTRELADYGNKLLGQKGFTYIFDVCGFLNENGQKLPRRAGEFFQPFAVQLTTVGGEKKNFQIAAVEQSKSSNGCFTKIAAAQVTDKEITVIADGKPVRLQRPKDFHPGKIELVDKTLKKVIRRWETPFQGEPLGISPDGRKLYLGAVVHEEQFRRPGEDSFKWLFELVLEVSESGILQFRTRKGLNLKEGERLNSFMTEENTEDVAYLRFLQNGNSYIIKSTISREFQIVLVSGLFTPPEKVHPIETKPLSQKNPTVYEFAHPVSDVREKLLTAFADYDLMQEFYSSFNPKKSSFRFFVGSREKTLLSKDIFENPENTNDLYLHSHGEVIGPSAVYFGGGKPLRYRAKFQLHLTALDDKRTKISIITHDPAVINGSVCCGMHGYKSNDVAVEPTTIEEYKILLFIGRILGVSDMPPLRMPEDL